tara:strand:+ start:2460 stop:3335 length:876 start_codon:yes stop_codon:yes gene_type:complete
MPDVTVLHTDVIGTTYVDSSFDYRKTKAIRKLIVKWDGAGDAANNDELVTALKTESGSSPNMETPLGPLWKEDGTTQTTGNVVVHPSNNELPLQTVEVTKMGDQRFLVTASYFVVPGTTGGALNVPQTCSMRAETAAIRLLKTYVPGGGDIPVSLVPEEFSCSENGSPYQHSVVATIAVVKIRVPFYSSRNPITTSGGILNYLGGRNARTRLGGIEWGDNALRFDGVTMDEMGSLVSDGANTYRFKGFYEFTARQDQFAEHVYNCDTDTVETHYPGIEMRNDGWTSSSFNI